MTGTWVLIYTDVRTPFVSAPLEVKIMLEMKEFEDIENMGDLDTEALMDLIATKVRNLKRQYPALPEERSSLRLLSVQLLALVSALTELTQRQQQAIDSAIETVSEARKTFLVLHPEEMKRDD